MLKKLLSFVLIPALLFSADFVKNVYNFEVPRVKDGMVLLNGCRISREGFAPCVAVKPVALVLQKGQEAVSFEVEYDNFTVLDGEHYLKPFTPSVNLEKGHHQDLNRQRSPVYDKNDFFPGSVKSNWFRVQYKNGIPIFVTLIKPVQYNPITGKIRYCKNISIKVHTRPARSPSAYNCTPAIKSLVQTLVDNPEATSTLPLTMQEDDDYEYLIVTTNSLKDSWNEFVEFNARRCLRTNIQTIDYIKSNIDGRDDAERLRNYIKQEYEANKITYAMLGGDAPNGLPDRGFRACFYDCEVSIDKYYDERDVTADMYYSCLDGDWKGDSTFYGEPGNEDMYWDIYACRFPVDDATDLNNMINKTIKYSEIPVKDQVTNLFLCGNFLWSQWGVWVYGGDHMDEFLDECTHNNYTTYGFPADKWSVTELYERDESWNVSDFRSRVNTFKPTWIEHLGHGNTTLAFEESNSNVTTSNYTNDGTNANFFILTTGACYPGNFDNSQDCLMEKFLSISTGAVATQAFTRTGMEDDNGTDGVGQRIRRFFHDAIFNTAKKIHNLEMALGNGKESNAEIVLNPDLENPPYYGALRFTTYGLNFLGDPALSFWTDTPKQFQADYQSPLTTTTFEWDTKNPYTWVALCNENGDIITTQFTGIDGTCKIDNAILKKYVEDNPDGKLVVRVKAHNYLPFEGELQIDFSTGISSSINDNFSFNTGFNPSGKIIQVTYTLPVKGLVTISIYNSKGLLINEIASKSQSAGKHSVHLNSSNLSNGIYYCRLKIDKTQCVSKFFVTK